MGIPALLATVSCSPSLCERGLLKDRAVSVRSAAQQAVPLKGESQVVGFILPFATCSGSVAFGQDRESAFSAACTVP